MKETKIPYANVATTKQTHCNKEITRHEIKPHKLLLGSFVLEVLYLVTVSVL
jgi:hypothetical protein